MAVRARPAILTVIVAFLVALPACGGDEGTDAPNLFDPARADEIAHAAILTVDDLPGSGWKVESEDKFDDESAPPADTNACRAIAARREAIRKKTDPSRSGRAHREMAADRGDIFPVSVEVQVNIFDSAAPVSESLAAAKGYLGGADFKECFQDLLEANLSEGVELASRTVTNSSAVPGYGAAVAIDLAIRAKGTEEVLRLETYIWRSANAGVTVTITGTPESVTRELTAAVLAKVEERLRAQETK